MKNTRATEIKVGITVLLGVLLFIWILGWTKNFSITSSDAELKVMFNNVSGLKIGNDVTVNGVKKGSVSDFYVYKTYVIVTIRVSNDIQLKKDAAFSLELTDLMGGRKIEISPGYSEEPLSLEATHRGEYKTDLAGVVALFSDLQDRLDIILKEVTDALSGFNSLVGDETFIKNVKNSLENFNRLSMNLEQVLDENRDNLKQISANTKEITEETKLLISSNRESLGQTIQQMNVLVYKSDSLITALNDIAQETREGENNLGKILYDDTLYYNLTESMTRLKELSKLILYQLQTEGLRVDFDLF
jgi:phospholipid/cholesterol/gamma-HCH transport system substrate-binding protein